MLQRKQYCIIVCNNILHKSANIFIDVQIIFRTR